MTVASLAVAALAAAALADAALGAATTATARPTATLAGGPRQLAGRSRHDHTRAMFFACMRFVYRYNQRGAISCSVAVRRILRR